MTFSSENPLRASRGEAAVIKTKWHKNERAAAVEVDESISREKCASTYRLGRLVASWGTTSSVGWLRPCLTARLSRTATAAASPARGTLHSPSRDAIEPHSCSSPSWRSALISLNGNIKGNQSVESAVVKLTWWVVKADADKKHQTLQPKSEDNLVIQHDLSVLSGEESDGSDATLSEIFSEIVKLKILSFMKIKENHF